MTGKSRILDEMQETARDLHDAGLMDFVTMRELDIAGLPAPGSESYGPAEIKALRRRLNVSQPVFAAYLGVRKGTVAGWEQGEKKPGGSALRLLSIADRKGLDAIT